MLQPFPPHPCRTRYLVLLIICGFTGTSVLAGEHEGYETREILGWTIHVSEKLLEDKSKETATAMKLFEEQLQKIVDRVPPQVVKKLQKVPIWFSPVYPDSGPKGEYHPGKKWLLDNGRRPELHRCVEFTNVSIFPKEVKRMPMLALHELAHAYHDQYLSFDTPEIIAAYKDARESGKYQKVKRHDGKEVKSYALTNHKEYFAELSESYFGVNDFYPFNNQDLQDYDPLMYRVLTNAWQVEDTSE
jgi:dipeptidyl-peptidase-4